MERWREEGGRERGRQGIRTLQLGLLLYGSSWGLEEREWERGWEEREKREKVSQS